jgi:hypothetical protein
MNAREGLRAYLPNNAPTPVLLSYATILTFVSCLTLAHANLRSVPHLIIGYIPFVVGGVTMWLCAKAHQRSSHRTAVVVYTILLAPFAFFFPVAWIYLFYMEATGQYHGPYP